MKWMFAGRLALAAFAVLAFSDRGLAFFNFFSLERVEKRVANNYALPHLPADTLRRWLATGDPSLVIFDVRTPAEYAVSRLPGAIQVDPDVDRRAFVEAHGPALAGKKVVFYCSVGVRSSLLGQDVERTLGAQVFNLRGGIFRWHTEGYPLADDGGTTRRVHGYNARWSRLLEDREAVVLSP
ncbi:MAG: rhodanese-like domain-containing protein [Candidatus Competibacterales bacterium]